MMVSKKRCLRFFSSPAYGKKALARRFETLIRGGGAHFLLIFLEIARFDLYQKALGVREGDNLRVRVIQAVKECAASVPRCLYGHIGEDAFALVLPFAGEKQTVGMVRALESRIREGGQYAIYLRFGLSVIDDFSVPFNDHFEGAVRAAATVKDQTSISYAFCNDALRAQIRREEALVRDLPGALREKQFVLRIQPKYDIQYNTPVGGEVLIRWQHPHEGLLMPEAFLPALDRYGLLPQLDSYVWEEVCQLLRKWTDEGRSPRPLSVRVSRAHFYDPQFEKKILSLVEKYALPPALLSLEVSGDAYADDPDTFGRVLHALRARGFTILMDDFWGGSSSLDMLNNFSVDQFKIDMRTILADVEPECGLNLLASVARIAKCLGLPVVVEGVEQAEQVDFLRGIGCEYAQGFYYAKPMIPEKYIALEWLEGVAIDANDFILRPIIPETAILRVNSVLETSNRFRALLREYHHVLEKSRTDPLTRIYNRIAMEEAVSDVLKRSIGETHALVMIDLDHYKSINDTYGHGDGDVVLTEFANRLIAFFRSGDLIARMGGDEFCVLMQKIRSGEDALAKCSQLCATIAQSPIGEGGIAITCSVGIAVSKPDSTFNQLYRAADVALYRSKELGMNRATLYREEDSSFSNP